MARGEAADIRHTVCHLPADGVEAAERGVGRDVALYVVDDAVELVERLGGLRIQIYVAREVERLHIVEMGYHVGAALGLSHKTEHLGMSGFAEYHYLRFAMGIILTLYATLQL